MTQIKVVEKERAKKIVEELGITLSELRIALAFVQVARSMACALATPYSGSKDPRTSHNGMTVISD